jgi:hypothetical protein
MTLSSKPVGTFILWILAFNSYGGVGFGDWICKTPNGNEIQNNGGTFLYLKNGQKLDGLNKWFFYKSFITGKQDKNAYFAVNEKTLTVYTFTSQQQWNRFIETRNLRPSVRER